jgi:predicted nucleic-acid-binding Zn-ribbon protein
MVFHRHSKDPGGHTLRCPRCFSTNIVRTETTITCKKCRYAEELIDFPVSRRS